MRDVECLITDRNDSTFIKLCNALNKELGGELAGPVDPISSRANKTDDFTDVIIALMDGEAVGCIALRPFAEGTYEIKRMYVVPDKRKSGIGRTLLEKCIAIAVDRGCRAVVLETNEKLPAAKRFYIDAGFKKTDSYGPYADLEDTLCMRRELCQD